MNFPLFTRQQQVAGCADGHECVLPEADVVSFEIDPQSSDAPIDLQLPFGRTFQQGKQIGIREEVHLLTNGSTM